MYFETGADCLWGMMSPGNIVSGHVVSGACCLPGQVVSGTDSLRGRLSRGILSPGHIASGADCLGAHCLGAPCPSTRNFESMSCSKQCDKIDYYFIIIWFPLRDKNIISDCYLDPCLRIKWSSNMKN